ncbi:hypothetical protein RWE15_12395 [Virgibacillus halophilus]|uniref:Uncharacterized protein n=1 Tax=Tigheibacillus halophilus TaxID=361280 RepID=A0ABU5C788_9BACI|nr:hypothetical protein [Virgibacillus halophilus]
MFQDIAENGSDAGYMIQGKDQQAIINLYTFTMNTLPQDMKNSIGQLVPEKKLSKLAGKSIKQALKDFELSSTAAASEKLIIKVKNGKSGKWVSQKNCCARL